MRTDTKRRVQNFLEPTSSKPKEKRFLVYDIESKAGDTQNAGFTRPFLVGMFDPRSIRKKGEGYQRFRNMPHLVERPWQERHFLPGGCIDSFMRAYLIKQYKNTIIYAHNGGNFDHLFILPWLQLHRDEFGFEVIPVQSSIQVVRVWRKPEDPEEDVSERWEFHDSIKLLNMPLEKACKTFKLPGKKEFNLYTHEDHPDWEIYLKQDCIALATVMTKLYVMVKDLGGEVGITTPSTAMRLFRRRFMGHDGCPEKISRWLHWSDCKNKKNDLCVGCMHDWIRRGYYGGRTEIFRFQGENLRYYDLNSSYVASMRNYMPIGDRFVEDGKLTWNRHQRFEDIKDPMTGEVTLEKNPKGRYSGFCECTVYIPPDCPVPPLPHRSKQTRKLIFPTGQFHGVWNIEELALLFDPFVKGEIRHVVKTVWFRLQPMFRQMVEELWKLRDKNRPGFDEGLSELAKLLGNGTYGKFAMKQERQQIVFRKDTVKDGECFLCDNGVDVPNGDVCKNCDGSKPANEDLESDVWYQAQTTDADYIIPHVAAHITALSRISLWGYMKMVVQLGGDIFYADTDSCICNVELPVSTQLGKMKDEYPGELLRYMAVQPKVYVIEKMKHNQEMLRRQTILDAAKAGDDSFDASTLDISTYTNTERKNVPFRIKSSFIRFNIKISEQYDSDSPYELSVHEKTTMKGFPKRMRTKDNFEKLARGDTLRWDQLEKVRSMARKGFRLSPQMRDVKKSFQSVYDKRIRLRDGSTRAIVLDEPLGGFDEASP